MFETINDHLLIRDQEWVGSRGWPVGDCAREPECQDRRGRRAIGYDAGKEVNGRKRHALVDADGRALVLRAHAAEEANQTKTVRTIGLCAGMQHDDLSPPPQVS